jgi:hypothetical protein
MITLRKTTKPLEAISRTGFLTSLVAYVVFWLVDLMEPGFVSRYFSVHIFLLTSLLFGLSWSSAMDEYIERPLVQLVLALIFGILLAVLTWGVAEGMDGNRLIVTIIALFVPWLVLRLLKS